MGMIFGRNKPAEANELKRVEHNLPDGGWIGVISDTHVPARARHIPKELFRLLDGASLIIHAGDLVEDKVITDLESIAPVEAVAGNMDSSFFHRKLGRKKIITAGGMNIGLVHGRGRMNDAPLRAYHEFFEPEPAGDIKPDGIIFGHTHFPVMEYIKGVFLLNPGSPVEPRMGSIPSCARLWAENNILKGKIIPLR